MGMLFVAFLVLKLAGAVDWSWWLVTAPLWVPVVAWGLFVAVVSSVVGFAMLVAFFATRRR
jgi:hypothetical protein